MFKSKYLDRLYKFVKEKYGNEPEYCMAIEAFFESIDYIVDDFPFIEKNAIVERLIIPERIIQFRVTWVDDNDKVQVNNGYRVQFNSAIGPYKGGIRFAENVNLSIMKFLGFEQTFKNSLTGLPMGGAKGGSDFNPIGKSDNEIMRFCQSFMAELYKYIGPNTDVPAGDFGVGAREIGYMYGMYRKLKNEWNGTFTGKSVSYGGSLGRPEATGYGLLYFASEMLKTFKNETFEGKRVLISGCGKVGSFATIKARELGAKIVGMSDANGYVYNENGLDIDFIIEHAKACGSFTKDYIIKYKDVKHGDSPRGLWNNPCNIALPCATQNEILIGNAKELKANGCYMVCEGANMPCSIESIRYFRDNNILFSPGKASNAGGVAVSGLEMTQNALHLSWSFEDVDRQLKNIMKNIFKICYETASKYDKPTNIILGANIAGFMKVCDAMIKQGVL